MRRSVFTIGLLFVLVGLFIISQGPKVLTPVAENLGLVSHERTENAVIAPTLVTVTPSDYSFLMADLKADVQVKGSLAVGDAKEVAFYVMDEPNFSEWRAGHPSVVIAAKPLAIAYNFTFTPIVGGTYYFIFDNQDTSRRTVVFSLHVVNNRIILSPIIEYSGHLVLIIGLLLSSLGIKAGRKKPEAEAPSVPGWKCKFCGAVSTSDEMFCTECGRSQT
jgi:hypothetical protein